MITLSPKKIVALARLVHAANKEYCATIGDTDHVAWSDLSEELRQATIDGVNNVLEDPCITGEEIHQAWMDNKREEGWVYGDVKDEEAKTHPCMIEYDKLSVEQRFKDDLFIGIINIYTDFKYSIGSYPGTNESEVDTLRLLFLNGPTEDGNLPSKADRDSLTTKGYVFRHNGYQSLTPKGLELCLALNLDREKERQSSRV